MSDGELLELASSIAQAGENGTPELKMKGLRLWVGVFWLKMSNSFCSFSPMKHDTLCLW
jgi:hypothetical protein